MERLLTVAFLLYAYIQFVLMLPFKQDPVGQARTRNAIVILAVAIFAVLLLAFFGVIHLSI